MTPPAVRPEALLWDIDGTLIDTTSLIVAALDHTYRTYVGRSMPAEDIRAIIGIPLCDQVLALGDPHEFGTEPAEMEAEFIRYYESNRQMERILPEVVQTLIRGKQAGLPTALITSKNLAEIANTLPRLGIAPYVDLIVSADDVKSPKPDPEGVLFALSTLNLNPERTIFIGDTVHDMRAGKSACVRCCAVTWGAGPRAMLLAENPDLICDNSHDLARLLSLE